MALVAAVPAAAQEALRHGARDRALRRRRPLDFPCRLLIDRLAAQTKGTFILEHRGGAGGAVGAQAVVQAPPDGGAFLFTSSSLAAAPAIYPKPSASIRCKLWFRSA